MTYRIAASLEVLREQINRIAPGRDKSSDGGIGDEAHASRSSDHNPWFTENGVGIVTARDFTNDPAHGMDSHQLALALVASRDERIKYVIDHGRICSGTYQDKPAWVWRQYTGENKHDHHVHVSVKSDKRYYDDKTEWRLNLALPPEVPKMPPSGSHSVLSRGSKGPEVDSLQRLLNAKMGAGLKTDGDFGPATEAAVKKFQLSERLLPDGKVGPYTWGKLEGKS
jgi:hypothetical protein